MDYSHDHWESMHLGERESFAKRLALELPGGFMFDSIRCFRLGKRENQVALFRFGAAEFAFIPAVRVTIGLKPERRWEPTPDELVSWQGTSEDYGIAKTIDEYITEVTLRPRTVDVGPFLVETKSGELGWETVGLDDADVQDIFREYGQGRHVEVSRGDVSTRVRMSEDGSMIAERSLARTHAYLALELQSAGFRFPTSDEWEYLCGCGELTLFRWGDHVPCDRYPTDKSPKEAAFRRDWVLSGGKLEYPPEGFAPDWDEHRKPNALGLHIASDPYKCELVAEIGTTRGGDGGCTICGGAGCFIGWLTLASAYFEEHSCRHDPTEPIQHGYTVGRKVLSLK